jgi:hypothetical protein
MKGCVHTGAPVFWYKHASKLHQQLQTSLWLQAVAAFGPWHNQEGSIPWWQPHTVECRVAWPCQAFLLRCLME